MALPQTVDPSTLNLSGKPAIATAPTTTTTVESKGMPAPTIAQEKSNVSPLLGALFGGALGMKYASSQAGKTGTGTGAGGTGGTGNLLSNLIKAVTSGGTPTGNIGSVSNVIVPPGMSATEAQNWLNQNYGTTNGQPNYIASGTNLSTGEIVGLPNTNIGNPALGTNTGNYGTTGGGSSSTGTTDTSTLTNIGNNYFMDNNSNVYDSNGNLIYQNPSSTTGTTSGTTTDTSGGYFQDSLGDIYDSLGNLVLAFNNGYYYEPDTGNFYDSTTFEPVGSDFNAYTDYFNIPTLDTSSYGDLGNYFDYGNYTSGSTTYIKDGGSVNKGGLATPLFAQGGNVKGYADGSLIEAATNMAPSTALGSSTPVATASQSSTGNTNTSGSGSILDSILGFAQNNPVLTGAGLGALLTQLINSNTSYPVNKGVDMTALGTLKPRTTPTGPARYVPYSEYGTPTTPYDYSTLYSNLGVSPFGGGVVSPSTPTSATPTPTTPTGALSTIAPSMPVTTPPTTAPTTAPATPTYYSDADGNIYDANGDLVYDTTTGSTTASTGTAVAPTTTTPTSGLAVPSLPTTTVADASYSYGTPVSPSEVLGAKKGGLAVKKMADGGMTDLAVTSLSDVASFPAFNPQGGIKYDIETGIVTDSNGNTMDVGQFTTTYGTHPSNFTPDFYPKDNTALETFYNSMSSIDPSQYDNYFAPEATYNLGNYGDITGQQIQDYFTMRNNEIPVYNQGMPTQGPAMPTQGGLMPTQGPAMPTQGPAMPTQGSAMPQQTPFSTSPTFRFSGANNPLLVGLRQQMPSQQPFMLNPAGQFVPREEISSSRTYGYAMGGQPMTDNLNVPVSSRPFQNVPAIQGRGDYRQGAYVEGEGDGQSDDIPAMLADGEYVIDAETVAQLGNGSNKAGAKVLDQFRKNIRAHKRSAPHDKIPPKAKSPLAYLKGAK